MKAWGRGISNHHATKVAKVRTIVPYFSIWRRSAPAENKTTVANSATVALQQVASREGPVGVSRSIGGLQELEHVFGQPTVLGDLPLYPLLSGHPRPHNVTPQVPEPSGYDRV